MLVWHQKKRILMWIWQNFCAEFYTFLLCHVLRRFNGSLWKSCKINFISVVWNFVILCNTIEANGLVSMIAIIYRLRLNRAFGRLNRAFGKFMIFNHLFMMNWFCYENFWMLRCLIGSVHCFDVYTNKMHSLVVA